MGRMKVFFRLFLLIILLILGVIGFLIQKWYGKITFSVFERTPPVVQIDNAKIGVGADATNVAFTVADDGVGLDEIVVRIEQNGKTQDVFRKQFDPQTYSDKISFSIAGKEKGLKEGEAQLHIAVFDKSFWNNAKHEAYSVAIDYTKPKLEVLTAQHNVAVGGVELVFYKLRSDDISASGVRIGETEFIGYPASVVSEDFSKMGNVFFAYFALPIGFDRNTAKPVVFARDKVGNTTAVSFNYLVIPKRYRDAEMKLNDDFLHKVYEELVPKYYELIEKDTPSKEFETLSEDEKRTFFKAVNEDYRGILAKQFKKFFSASEAKQFWNAPWVRPLNAAPTSTFGETRQYSYNGTYASTSLHAGVDLADVANAPVHPANNGKVVFADYGGIYGNTVIIDHGVGFFTLYGHLSSIISSVGDEVTKETQIARSGATGLAGGDHLHFEIRLQGVPVTPIEWWDEHWIREHIIKKIQSVKDQLQAQAALDAQIR